MEASIGCQRVSSPTTSSPTSEVVSPRAYGKPGNPDPEPEPEPEPETEPELEK